MRRYEPHGVYRARVTRVAAEGVYVEVPRWLRNQEYGPLQSAQLGYVAGDRVLVGFVEGISDDPVLLGPLHAADVAATPHTHADTSTDWANVTAFDSGWTSYGGAYPAQYRRKADGDVVLRGVIRTGNYENAALTLPVGFRPDFTGDQAFPCVAWSGSLYFIAFALMAATGVLNVNRPSGVPTQSGTYYLHLDAVRYPAE